MVLYTAYELALKLSSGSEYGVLSIIIAVVNKVSPLDDSKIILSLRALFVAANLSVTACCLAIHWRMASSSKHHRYRSIVPED